MTLKQKIITFNDYTGEILDEKIKGLYNPFNPEKGYNYKYKSRTIKHYLDTPLPDCFSDAEVGKIFRLSRHIYGDSNMLGRRVKSYVVPYKQEDIIKIFGLKDRQGRALLKKMTENRILKKVEFAEQGKTFVQFYFNPIYFFSGTYLNLNLFLIFQDEMNGHIPDNVILKFLEQAEKLNEERGIVGGD